VTDPELAEPVAGAVPPDSPALAPPLAADEADEVAFDEPESDLGVAVSDAEAGESGLAVESFRSPQLTPESGGVAGAEAVAVAVVPAEADAEAEDETPDEPVFGVVGGLLATVGVSAGLELCAGAEVCAGTEVSGVVLGDMAGELAGAVHDEIGDGCLVTVVEVWPLVPVPEGAATAPWPGVPEPATLPLLLLGLCPDSTEELSWKMACRNGGTAAATPIANTAQAIASAGLSRTSRMSRPDHQLDRRRARGEGRVGPARPGGADGSLRPGGPDGSGDGEGTPRRPYSGIGAALARVGAAPGRILARMRSRPSACGSTCSAAACSAARTYSAKSCGGPSVTSTPAPARSAARPCRGPCGS